MWRIAFSSYGKVWQRFALICSAMAKQCAEMLRQSKELYRLAMLWRSLVTVCNVMVKHGGVWQWNRTVKYRNAEAEQGRVMKCIAMLTKRR